MSNESEPMNEQQSGQSDEAQRLAKLIAASIDDEQDLGVDSGLLQLPDDLSTDDEPLAGEDPAETEVAAQSESLADAEDENATHDLAEHPVATEQQEALTLPDELATTAETDSEELGPSWVTDGDSRPLLYGDDEDESAETLRQSIQSHIGELGSEEAEEEVPQTIDLPPREIRAAVEALLLVNPKPMTEERLAGCLPGASHAYLRGLLEGLSARYTHEYRGWDLRCLAGGWQLLTRPALHPWVRQLDKHELPSKLSKSAMETLAIVAYKQPVTRGDIEDIRGVQCGPMLRQLMDLKLAQVLGRNDDAVGRPLLYGTSKVFLDRFGLGSLADLPRQHEFGN